MEPYDIVRMSQAQDLLSCCIPTVYKMVERGDLPKPVKPNGNLIYWERGVFNAAVKRLRDRAIEEAHNKYRLAE